jgi:hypothetical protein
MLVDRLLRSRAWVWLIGIMLGGIVAMQVSLLKLNTGISNAIRTQETMEHQNATMQADIAQLSSGERVRMKAADLNMIDPEAGNTRYVKSRGVERDAPRAAKRFVPPSMEAQLVDANGGKMPGVGATLESLRAQQSETATQVGGTSGAQPQATATPTGVTPTATADPLPTPTGTGVAPTPTPTGTGVAPTPTVQATDPATGLATAG